MGTPSFAATIIDGLIRDEWNVVGTVTQPDRPRGRGRKVSVSPVKQVALEQGIPVLQPGSIKDPAFSPALRELRPDLAVVAAFGQILSAEVLSVPPLGCFNIHASILPRYRGAAPIQWAIMNGEGETGITIFHMDEGTDTGNALAVTPLAIDPEETYGELADRLAALAVRILPAVLESIVRGETKAVPQDHSIATMAPLLKKTDGVIDWNLGAQGIRDKIRGQDPWPGAYTFWKGKRLRLWEASAEPACEGGAPGEILPVRDNRLRVQTAEGVLGVGSVQLEGKKRMKFGDFVRGHPMPAGERLG